MDRHNAADLNEMGQAKAVMPLLEWWQHSVGDDFLSEDERAEWSQCLEDKRWSFAVELYYIEVYRTNGW